MDDWWVAATQVRGEGSGNTAVYCKCHKAVRRLQGLRVYTQIMQSKVHNINECLHCHQMLSTYPLPYEICLQCFITPLPSIRHHRSCGDCLEGKGENYQICSVQYCVQQLCTVQCTHI